MKNQTTIQIPKEFKRLFDNDWREAAIFGGRFSLKSHTVARALLIKARQKKTRVACFREFQNSIAESSYQLLADLIKKYNLTDFELTQNSIINKINGSDFIFRGLWNNEQSIKSIEGIDIAWCFPAGTKVDNKNIEDYKKGDFVSSFNHKTGKIEERRVLAVMKREKPEILYKLTDNTGRTVIATGEHPFYTDKGYIPIKELKIGDIIYEKNTNARLYGLLRGLWRQVQGEYSRKKSNIQKTKRNVVWKLSSKKDIREDEEGQSNVKQEVKGEDVKNIKRNGTQTKCFRWKWKGLYKTSDIINKKIGRVRERLVERVSNTNRKKVGRWFPFKLQVRFSEYISRFNNRNRWEQAQGSYLSGKGQKKRQAIRGLWVESIEIYKQGSDDKHRRGGKNNYVYNIEVERNNNYFANGLLVHNCEEAQSISEKSIEVLTPTIRKDGSQIIYTYNRLLEDDPVHKRLVLEGRPNTLIVNVNYDIAEKYGWLPDVIRDEIEDDKKNRPKLYKHKWLGEPFTDDIKIYRDWNRIDEIPHEARLERYGLDFGYTNDPSSIIAIYYYNGGYILDEILYQKGLSNKEIADTLKNIDRALVIADSAEPKSIDEIKSYGINIIPCQKGKDSVKFGIQYVQDQKINYTSRSYNLEREYKGYIWKTDKNGIILNIPAEVADHALDAVRYGLDSFKPRQPINLFNNNKKQFI